MSALRPLHRNLLCVALSLALSGCGDAAEPSAKTGARVADARIAAPPAEAAAEKALVSEIAASLQACSYDGAPLALSPAALSFSSRGAGAEVVAEIMRYTGLPQNFDVIEGPVPNAAAVIVLGPDKLPRRVIAYNRDFMEQVRRATRNNDWAPISIMAHEIGHHLSGHTITPGGSQPPTELEADKFSGFVLYKMGSSLADAKKALETLVPEQDGRTHPGRRKRVAAIEDGWGQACSQQSDDCRSGTASRLAAKPAGAAATVAAATPATAATAGRLPAERDSIAADVRMESPQVADEPRVAAATRPARPAVDAAAPAAPAPAASAPGAAGSATVRADQLPRPDANAIAAKFDRFVYDEYGLLDAAERRAFETRMFEHAQKHHVEIVSLLVKDLHGLSADDYAYAMLRQLRVGKLDVGNGAVLVAAPDSGEVGVAMGPGVQRQMKSYVDLEKRRLSGFAESGFASCKRNNGCNAAWSERFFAAAAHIADDTDFQSWTIRYQNLGELAAAAAQEDARRDAGGRYDPANDPVRGQILRLQGDLRLLDARQGEYARHVLDHADSDDADLRTLQVATADGRVALIEADPHTEQLMPTRLAAGTRYEFIVRVRDAGFHNPKDPLRFELLSYSSL